MERTRLGAEYHHGPQCPLPTCLASVGWSKRLDTDILYAWARRALVRRAVTIELGTRMWNKRNTHGSQISEQDTDGRWTLWISDIHALIATH